MFWSRPYRQAERMIRVICREDVTTVTHMLEAGISPNNATAPSTGLWKYLNILVESAPEYPLSAACLTGNLEMVQLLLEYGADPVLTEQEDTDWSALSSAILGSNHENSVEIVKLLLDYGADPESRKDYYLPVELASMEYPTDEDHARRIVELVKLLMGDLDVNHADGALLWHAAKNGNLPLVEYLLSIGADPGIQAADGTKAYDLAVMWEHDEVARILNAAEENAG